MVQSGKIEEHRQCILCIETSSELCHLILCDICGLILGSISLRRIRFSSDTLVHEIEHLFKVCGISVSGLVTAAVSSGPGSYTGIKVGVSSVIGICQALGIKMIVFNILESLANFARSLLNINDVTYCSIIYIQGKTYCDLKNIDEKDITLNSINDKNLESVLKRRKAIVIQCHGCNIPEKIIENENVKILKNIKISSQMIVDTIIELYKKKDFTDLENINILYKD